MLHDVGDVAAILTFILAVGASLVGWREYWRLTDKTKRLEDYLENQGDQVGGNIMFTPLHLARYVRVIHRRRSR
jgi:hypothetical protein